MFSFYSINSSCLVSMFSSWLLCFFRCIVLLILIMCLSKSVSLTYSWNNQFAPASYMCIHYLESMFMLNSFQMFFVLVDVLNYYLSAPSYIAFLIGEIFCLISVILSINAYSRPIAKQIYTPVFQGFRQIYYINIEYVSYNPGFQRLT